MELKLSGWGRNKFVKCKVYSPKSILELKKLTCRNSIARGLGRSYGDSAIQSKCTIITTNLNKVIDFNKNKGIINAEAGTSINELIKVILPIGWFLPVTPGSKDITLGGMIASDVHGKNHHKVGSFRNHIIEIQVLIKKNKLVKCSKTKNEKLFNYTVGGMGLTGIIYSCKFKLIKVSSNLICQETIKNKNLSETLRSLKKSTNWSYNVAWLDTSATGKNKGRSVLIRGEHLEKKNKRLIDTRFLEKKKINIFFQFPKWFMNSLFIKILNSVYFKLNKAEKKFVNLDSYFYQLDKIKNWNLIYGKKGFISYQCVVPHKKSQQAIEKILDVLIINKSYSFVSVIKLLGRNDGFLSFGIKGYTLVFDFPIYKNIYEVLEKIDNIVMSFNGRIYLTKDSRIKKNNFKKINKNFQNLNYKLYRKKFINSFNSMQSQRLGI